MAKTAHKRSSATDDIWFLLRAEVEDLLRAEPVLEKFYRGAVLEHDNFGNALSAVLASRLQCEILDKTTLARTICNALQNDHGIIDAAQLDLLAFCQRDPACNRYSLPFLYYKGYQGLQMYRVGRWLWKNHHRGLSRFCKAG